jgi:predicted metal-dependent hydrolase
MVDHRHDGTRREYIARTSEEIRAELNYYANAAEPTGREFERWVASLIYSIAIRQVDGASTLRVLVELMQKMCDDISKLEERMTQIEERADQWDRRKR